MGLLCAARVWALHVRDEFPLPGEGSVRVLLLNSSLRGRDHPFETRGVSEAEKDAPFPGIVPCFFVGFLLIGSRGSVRFSADAIARRGITHVNSLLCHMAEVLEQVTGNFPIDSGVQGTRQVVTNAVGPSRFEGFGRQQPAPGYAGEVCSPFYGGQDISLVELLAESEVKVVVCRGPVPRGDVLRGGNSLRFPAVLRFAYLDLWLLTPPVVVCGIAWPRTLFRASPFGCRASAVREARPEGACTGRTCVGDSLRELPGILAGFSAPREASPWASVAQGCVDVVLGASTRESGQSRVIGDDPSTLAVALFWGVDWTAAVFTQVHRDDQSVTASQDLLPAGEVERRRITAGRTWRV